MAISQMSAAKLKALIDANPKEWKVNEAKVQLARIQRLDKAIQPKADHVKDGLLIIRKLGEIRRSSLKNALGIKSDTKFYHVRKEISEYEDIIEDKMILYCVNRKQQGLEL